MALNTQLSDTTANAQASALITLLAGGTCKVYNGSQPANGNTAITTQTLLLTLSFGTPAAPAPVAGVISFGSLGPSTVAASGTAVWYRCFTASGVAVMDGSVGVSGCNMNLSTSSLSAGANVTINSWTHTVFENNAGS